MKRRLAVLALLTIGVAACGGDEGGGASGDNETFAPPDQSDETAPDETAPDGESPADGAAMTTMLGLVPDAPGASDLVIVSDFAAAVEAVGLDPPGPGADQDAIVEWYEALTIGHDGEQGAGLQISQFLNNELTDDAGWRAEIGWAPLDVTRSVETTGDEFGSYDALTGDFDPDTIDDAVHEDPVWSDELEVVTHGEVDYYQWGEDDERQQDYTILRPIGLGGRLALPADGTLLWTRTDDSIEAGIDAATGESDSLADTDDIGALAAALDDEGALAGVFSDDRGEFPTTSGPALVPYAAMAVGTRLSDGGQEMIVALLHDDPGAAEENVGRLETIVDEGFSVTGPAWSELVTLESAEADGDVLVATLSVADPAQALLWLEMIYQRDTLLASS